MKKIALGILAVAISFATIAQDGKKEGNNKHSYNKDKKDKKEWKHNGKANGKLKQLDLTDAQSQQLKTINENFRNQLQSLQADKSLSEAARKERRQALTTEHRNQIHAILTPEQRQQWQTGKNEGGRKRKHVK